MDKLAAKYRIINQMYKKAFIIPLILIVCTFILPFNYNLFLFSFYIIFLTISSPFAFKRLNSYFLWVFLLLTIVFYPMTESENSLKIFGAINYNLDLMKSSISMVMRAIMILTALSLLNNANRNNDINILWRKVGIDNYEEIKTEVDALVPVIKGRAKNVYKELKSGKKESFIDLISRNLAELLINPNQKSKEQGND
ncbi:MAG: hypothetical protein KIT33_10540 [Candidatus Kapabacteria bacterium]|nr:hypothetical protein [Ignavibacteriota bacterium]MCW5885397.1 hypothetical protein [Candidatus Kapabacteria bacterium]